MRENQLIELVADKMPVGKHDKDQMSFTQHEFHLEKGDTKEAFRVLLFYYDKCYERALYNRKNTPQLLVKIPCEALSLNDLADMLIAKKSTCVEA